ncbi:Endonuclease/exonuclease/phosphatase [Chiua virens]|nr:Endonuclease/exonuclease/phosphatase [Chiua virens]
MLDSDIDEVFIPSPPSELADSSSDTQQTTQFPRGRSDMLDIPRPLRAVRFSMHKKRWAQTSNCARGIKEPLPSSLRVLTWNVDFASKSPKKRLSAALEYIRQDVFKCKSVNERPEPCCILLQEVSAAAFTLVLTNEWVQRSFLVVPSSTEKWPHTATYGNVTLVSRTVPVCGAFTIDFSNSEMSRNGLFVDVKLAVPAPREAPRLSDGIVQVRIANTHLESLPRGERARPEQLRIIAEALQEYELQGGIVGGDMNAIGPTDMRIAEEVGLMDAWQGTDDDAEGFTWGYQPPCEHPTARLDKVLWVSRGGMEVEEPVRVGIGAKVTSSGEWISDHYGLVTNVHVVSLSPSYDHLTMKTILTAIALLASGVLAYPHHQHPVSPMLSSVNRPSFHGRVVLLPTTWYVSQCILRSICWISCLCLQSILPGASPNGAALESFSATNSTSYTWTVNIAQGTYIGFTLRDSTGAVAQSAAISVQPGSSGCLTSSSAITGASAPAATSGGSGATTTPSGASASSSNAATTPASSPSASGAGSSSTGGAPANVAQFGAAGFAGAVVAAILL